MARGGHGLPKVSSWPAMPYSSTPCGLVTPETVVSWVSRLQGGLRPVAVFYPFGHPTPYTYEGKEELLFCWHELSRFVVWRLCKHLFGIIVDFLVNIGVWQGVAMNSQKFHPGPPMAPCPTLLHPAGRRPLKRPKGRFRDGPPAGRAACGRFPPPRTPRAVGLCWLTEERLKEGLSLPSKSEAQIRGNRKLKIESFF
jgi:hypothetical protein